MEGRVFSPSRRGSTARLKTHLSMTACRLSTLESFHSSKASSALSTALTMSSCEVSGTRESRR